MEGCLCVFLVWGLSALSLVPASRDSLSIGQGREGGAGGQEGMV